MPTNASSLQRPGPASFVLALPIVSFLFLLPATPSHATAQRVGDFEVSLDAPWRMEPRAGGLVACDPLSGCSGGGIANGAFGAIPLQVSITDADMPNGPEATLLQKIISVEFELAALWRFVENEVRSSFGWVFDFIGYLPGLEAVAQIDPLNPADEAFHQPKKLERFVGLHVAEWVNGSYQLRASYRIDELHEVESTRGVWQWAASQSGPESAGAPPPRPAHSLCRVWDGEDCRTMVDLRNTSEWHAIAMYEPHARQPGADVRLRLRLLVLTERGEIEPYTQYVSVHLGEAPLPRFGDPRWVYGDLHYHAQGTDNDGETGYAYRGVLQAMSAMGLDFAFATDHASNSPQIGAARPAAPPQLIEPLFHGVRDLTPDRFAFSLDLLNGSEGANREVLSYGRDTGPFGSLQATPQIFLGAEVDVIPEFEPNDPPPVSYTNACEELPWIMKLLALLYDPVEFIENVTLDPTSPLDPLDSPSSKVCVNPTNATSDGRLLVRDVQGPVGSGFLSSEFYARQHLLHLPVDPTRADVFIASNTSKYGGATRRLGEILDVELGQRQKGVAFVAHPFSRAHGRDAGRAGPDIVPFSVAQLRDVFASEHILGMQFWNENGQMSTGMGTLDAADSGGEFVPVADLDGWRHMRQRRKQLHEGFMYWDWMLLWGLDPNETAGLDWLSAGEPRRLFMAGGSDAHGDLNYRREGAFTGTSSVNDTAIGTPRNLVFAGDPAGAFVSGPSGVGLPHSQQQVVDALRAGSFAVTDGPAVRIALDANQDGEIDDDDVPMGGVARQTGGSLHFVVEWESTEEFGPVEEIELFLGVAADEHAYGMLYRGRQPETIHPAYVFTDPTTGDAYVRTPQLLYWHEPFTSELWIEVPEAEGFAGRRTVVIRPGDFPVGLAHAVCPGDLDSEIVPMSVNQQIGGNGGFEWEQGPWQPPGGGLCDFEHVFENPVGPDRLFLRAAARNAMAPGTNPSCDLPGVPTTSQDARQCIFRHAFTNPVWVNYADGYTAQGPYTSGELSAEDGSGSGRDATPTQAPQYEAPTSTETATTGDASSTTSTTSMTSTTTATSTEGEPATKASTRTPSTTSTSTTLLRRR